MATKLKDGRLHDVDENGVERRIPLSMDEARAMKTFETVVKQERDIYDIDEQKTNDTFRNIMVGVNQLSECDELKLPDLLENKMEQFSIKHLDLQKEKHLVPNNLTWDTLSPKAQDARKENMRNYLQEMMAHGYIFKPDDGFHDNDYMSDQMDIVDKAALEIVKKSDDRVSMQNALNEYVLRGRSIVTSGVEIVPLEQPEKLKEKVFGERVAQAEAICPDTSENDVGFEMG